MKIFIALLAFLLLGCSRTQPPAKAEKPEPDGASLDGAPTVRYQTAPTRYIQQPIRYQAQAAPSTPTPPIAPAKPKPVTTKKPIPKRAGKSTRK